MLGESKRHNKQNSKFTDLFSKESDSLINNTVRALKQQISSLQLEKVNLERKYVGDIEILQLEIGQYKKKLAVLTDKYLLETFTKDQKSTHNPKDYDQIIRQQEIVLQQQKQSKKKVEARLKQVINETVLLKKQLQQMKLEKEKSMEISVVEKIDLEQKNKLLEEQVSSKKNIISNLKRQLEKAYSNQQDLNKQERSIAQKSKELEYYSQELNEYNRLNDLRLKQQLSQLGKQNQFLKDYVKKIEKMAKKECQCQGKDEKVRQNLFQIKRELALAKVKLGQNYFQEVKKDKKVNRVDDQEDNESNYSFDRRRV